MAFKCRRSDVDNCSHLWLTLLRFFFEQKVGQTRIHLLMYKSTITTDPRLTQKLGIFILRILKKLIKNLKFKINGLRAFSAELLSGKNGFIHNFFIYWLILTFFFDNIKIAFRDKTGLSICKWYKWYTHPVWLNLQTGRFITCK